MDRRGSKLINDKITKIEIDKKVDQKTSEKQKLHRQDLVINHCRTFSLTSLDDLNFIRQIKYDKMSHVTILTCVLFWKNNRK